jgi:hypothetical protein
MWYNTPSMSTTKPSIDRMSTVDRPAGRAGEEDRGDDDVEGEAD